MQFYLTGYPDVLYLAPKVVDGVYPRPFREICKLSVLEDWNFRSIAKRREITGAQFAYCCYCW